jgi:tryptophanase
LLTESGESCVLDPVSGHANPVQGRKDVAKEMPMPAFPAPAFAAFVVAFLGLRA